MRAVQPPRSWFWRLYWTAVILSAVYVWEFLGQVLGFVQ
jgi:hypothetical protein